MIPIYPQYIHEYLRNPEKHMRPVQTEHSADRAYLVHKKYPRMPQIQLDEPTPLTATLEAVLAHRESAETCSEEMISMGDISTLLGHALQMHPSGKRPYPSGGAKYPIETYLIAQGINDLPKSVFHYSPTQHVLEHLWAVPPETPPLLTSKLVLNEAPMMLVFTSMWERTWEKYGDFGYYLSLLEAGHMAQNVLLVATAMGLASRPIGGFDDAVIAQLLDIDTTREQVVYVVPICKR